MLSLCTLIETTVYQKLVPSPFFFLMIILSMHRLPRVNVMLDFIFVGPVYLPGARLKRQNTNNEK